MSYTHFAIIERGKLEGFIALNKDMRAIARLIGRHHSSISREINRNKEGVSYNASKAHDTSKERRTIASSRTKLSPELIDIIEVKLQQTWSPEQIS